MHSALIRKPPLRFIGSGMSRTSCLSLLLQRLEGAFLDGRNRYPSHVDASPLSKFADGLESSIARGLTQEEWSFIKSCSSRQNKALRAAQQDHLEEAHQQVREVWERVRSRSLSLEGRLVIQVFLKPVDAYLSYRRQDYDQARELVLHASAIDQRLVTDFGYVLLSAHRLQLAHNLLRIHTRREERSDAMQLGGTLLDYLELRVEPSSDVLLCARTILDSVPDMILQYYFDKICGELAILLAGNTDAVAAELFQSLMHHTDHGICPNGGFGFRAHAWMHAKQLALGGEVEGFLVAATDLLRLGRMAEPALWFATIIDVVGLCRSLGLEGLRLSDRIVAEASTLTDAPRALKQAARTEIGAIG